MRTASPYEIFHGLHFIHSWVVFFSLSWCLFQRVRFWRVVWYRCLITATKQHTWRYTLQGLILSMNFMEIFGNFFGYATGMYTCLTFQIESLWIVRGFVFFFFSFGILNQFPGWNLSIIRLMIQSSAIHFYKNCKSPTNFPNLSETVSFRTILSSVTRLRDIPSICPIFCPGTCSKSYSWAVSVAEREENLQRMWKAHKKSVPVRKRYLESSKFCSVTNISNY